MDRIAAEELSSSVTSSSPLASFMSIPPISLNSPYTPPFLRDLKSDERGLLLIHLLLNCAAQVAAGNIDQANAFLEQISFLASPDGDTMQRIASHFTEALARRLLRSWPGLYRALIPDTLPHSSSSPSTCHLFPFLRLSSLVSNQAILEAMEGEKVVHVVDLSGSDASQWVALLQSFAARRDGPPHLRVTAVGESRELLATMASTLSEEAEKLDIPFRFHAVVSLLDALDVESLRVKTGEALAITSLLQLHPLLAPNSAAAVPPKKRLSSKVETFLSSLHGLSPKIMVVTEQESNHNGSGLKERFVESLYFYAAMFDCLELTVARRSAERVRVERQLGEEIRNIVACEGTERKARHEKLERWMQRMEMCGFVRVGLSFEGLMQGRRMIQGFGSDGFRVKEENGSFFFCWQERALFSVSAWRFRR